MRTRLAAALATLALAVAGCSSGASPDARPVASHSSAPAPAPAPEFGSYVALGDSYTAAPLVPTTDLADGCLRSDHNYPTLLAKRLHVRRLTDVSCSGATTGDLTHRQHTFRQASVPPQLRAVRRDTDLVTVGIGGNDFDLFGTLAFGCSGARGTPGRCTATLTSAEVARDVRRIGDRVAAVLRDVKRRAPHATVVLVGYLRLLPERGGCAQVGSLTGRDRGASRGLADAMRSAARRTGVRFLDAYAFSKGHDVCALDPWVNGPQNRQGVAAAFHPLASGERALATRLDRMLS
ncbi:MAG: SGNH/GDSL hydrolase family protein [Nocardioidaceae bacterium]